MIHAPNPPSSSPPKIVYLTLWFPLASETFVFYEVEGLYQQGLPVSVASLYNFRKKGLSHHMLTSSIPVLRLGMAAMGRIFAAVVKRIYREPRKSLRILKQILFTRWRDTEMRLESLWACLGGFYLAQEFKKQNITHIHAAWATGAATAAWVIHQLEGTAYSFTARAGDVHPPDGMLAEKLRDCTWARADSSYNVPHLQSFLPAAQQHKVHLVYNISTLPSTHAADVPMQRPYVILAIGRLVETKGFQFLIDAASILRTMGYNTRVNIAGSGKWLLPLKHRIMTHALQDCVHMLGFVTHDKISSLILHSDMLVMPCIVQPKTGDSDGLPTVIIEAMCHGLPVVAADVASVGDVVLDGETGYLVPQRDAYKLADAMRKLMDDRENALRMAHNARERVYTLFDVQTNLAAMRALLTRTDIPPHAPNTQNTPNI